MSTANLRRVFSSIRNNPRALVDAMLRRSDRKTQSNLLEQLEPRQLLSAIPDWVNQVGSSGSSTANAVVTADDGSVYAAGAFVGSVDFDPGVGVFNATAANEFGDGFVVKYDSKGAFVWLRHFAGDASGSSFAADLSLDDDSNLYIGGRFDSTLNVNFGAGTQKLTTKGQSDIFVAKVAPDGSMGYLKQLGSNSSDQFWRFVTTRSEDIVFSGNSSGKLDLDTSAGVAALPSPLSGFQDFIVRYTPDFTYQTHMTIGGDNGFSSGAFGESTVIADKNTLIVTGTVKRDAKLDLADGSNLITFNIPENTTFSFEGRVAFVASIDTSEGLKLNWVETFDSSRSVNAIAVDTDSSGNIYFGVNYNGDIDLDPTEGENIFFGGASSIPALISLTSTGSYRFSHSLNALGEVRDIDVTENPLDPTDTQIFTVGDFSGTAQFDPAGSAEGKRKATTGGAGYVWVIDEHGNFVDAAALYSAKGGAVSSGSTSVRGIDAIFDGPVNIVGSFEGTTDFDASTGVHKLTTVSEGSFDSNAFTASYSSTGVADDGTVVLPTFTATSPSPVDENSGTRTILNWATPSNVTGTPTYTVEVLSGGSLLSVPPAVSSTGTLTYTPAANQFGNVSFRVKVAGTNGESSFSTFSIVVNEVVVTSTTHTFSQGKNYVTTVPGGNKVTFSLTGSGSGTVTVSDTGELLSVLITGSTSKSSFNVSVSGKANAGTATIGSIAIGKDGDASSDAIGSISASKLNVASGIIDVESSASAITLNNLNDVAVTIGAAAATGTSFKLGAVVNSNLMAAGLISGIDATAGWDTTLEGKGHISATGISKINIKGDFEASVMLSGVAKGNALGNVTVSGVISNATWDINGNTGILNALGAINFNLDANAVQGFGIGKSGISNAEIHINSAGAFTIAGNVNNLDLTLQTTGTSSKLLTNLSSFTVGGTATHITVATGANTNLGAFTFKGAAGHVQITGATAGTIAGIKGTSIDSLTVTTGNLTSMSFTGQASHVTLNAAGTKVGAISFKNDLAEAVFNLTAAPAKSTSVLTSFSVAGTTYDLTFNAASANTAIGSLTLTKAIENVILNVSGDLGAIKTGAVNGLHINKAGKIASLNVTGDLSKANIDALAITGAFAVSGKVTELDLTLNTARAAAQPVNFKALGSMTVAGAGTDVNVSASGVNSNFGAFIFKGALSNASFSTPATIAGITGTSGANINVDAGSLKALTFSSDINSISIQAGSIGGFSTKGALSKANIVVVNSGTKDFTAIGPFTVSGPTNTVSILSANANGNLGAFSLGSTVSNVLMNIGGDIASFKAGSVESLDLTSPGKVGAFTLTGGLTSSNIDVLALGAVTIAGNVNKAFITVNTDQPAQPSTFVALTRLTISGTANNLNLTAAGLNSNVGALTFNKGLTSGIFDIQGTAASFTSKGAVDNLTGSIAFLKALTVTGNVSNSSISSDQIGAAKVTGNITGLNLNLNPIGSSESTNKALGSLSVSGNAANVVISAPGLNSHLGAIDIKGAATGFQAFVTGDTAKISAGSFDANTILSVAGKIAGISTGKAGNLDGSIAASSITSINVGGNFMGEVISLGLSGIGAVVVTGSITSGLFRAQGNILSITAGSIVNSTILSGYDNNLAVPTTMPISATGFVNTTATIGTITIKSTSAADSFVNSKIMGVKIGTVTLKLVDTTNAGVVIGLAATKELGPVTRTDPANPTKTIKVNKITLPAQSVQTNDFAIRILPA